MLQSVNIDEQNCGKKSTNTDVIVQPMGKWIERISQ